MLPLFWEDGYTADATIPGVARLHPSLSFRYRPALFEERAAWKMGLERDFSGADRGKRLAELIAEHVVSWNARTLQGREVNPKDSAIVRRLHPEVQEAMLAIILGYTAAQQEADEKNDSRPATAQAAS